LTSHIHTKVAQTAITNGVSEKLCTKPGASRATLAAGCAGMPVCREIQTTQMTRAQPVKKIRVNQSISAPTLRLSVGRAKAASAASAGSASSNERSAAPVVKVAALATATNQSGNQRCSPVKRSLTSCRRQRQSVSRANGQAGQVNHRKSLPRPCHCDRLACGSWMRQRHKSSTVARAAQVMHRATSASVLSLLRAASASSDGVASRYSDALPSPKAKAMEAAPDSVSPNSATPALMTGVQGR